MKLELKYLAPYLPYKLKVQYWDRKVVMNAGSGSSKHWIGINAIIQRQGDNYNCYPLLRPLSDLTEEIEVNGNRFIPIVEIAKLTEPYFDWEIEDGHVFNSLNVGNYYEFWYDKPLEVFRFEFVVDCDVVTVKYPNSQLECFNKLFEWHFDIYGLIDEGLALNIND